MRINVRETVSMEGKQAAPHRCEGCRSHLTSAYNGGGVVGDGSARLTSQGYGAPFKHLFDDPSAATSRGPSIRGESASGADEVCWPQRDFAATQTQRRTRDLYCVHLSPCVRARNGSSETTTRM